ncbi:MAG TPA: hypothetical protein VGV37_19120 [Aliidongia sp.]|uniref:hypothetical protein n=1 Tax=Aliidongia sp. TaxID=1914230 RepID=UPI002DDCC934|nr:hypothetical protein [Aliidongia sp.]HEV2676645.1 hypothetical protein [Aliidongia sp.]
MAKPPAIRPQRALARPRSGAAVKAVRRPVRKPVAPKKVGTVRLFFLGLVIIGLATFAAPTCVLLLVGMVPSIVAYVVDRNERPMLAFTVAPLNLAGLMHYLLRLWTGGDTMPAAVHMLTDVYVWLVIYLSAGAGWLLFLGMPTIVAITIGRSLNSRKAKLDSLQARLRADWGTEVAGTQD